MSLRREYDVIVAGGGPAGVTAAVAAARNGAKTLLIERYGFLGGMGSAALVGPWMTFHADAHTQVVKGIADEIVERLKEVGGSLGHVPDTTGYVATVTPFDPELLKVVNLELVLDAGAELLLHTWVTDAIKEGDKVVGLRVFNKSGHQELYGKIIIDATGDGDVAAAAGAQFQIGREEDGLTQPLTLMFTLGNVDLDEVRAYMKENPDDFYRQTQFDQIDDAPHLSVNGFYSHLRAARKAGEVDLERDMVLFFQTVRPNEVTVNMTRAIKIDGTDAWQMTQAEIALRRQMIQLVAFFRKRIPGFSRSYLASSGFQAGVRETRRIMGDYVLTIDDIVHGVDFPDTIARNAYPVDIHSPDGEGVETITIKAKAYSIPLRCLLPKGLEGLMVAGRCLSCTHETLAAVRTQPSVMAMGQSAGTAAALAVRAGQSVRELDIEQLQTVLRQQGVNLDD